MSLDDDIAAWAATVRLADAEADAIFQRIVQTQVSAAPGHTAPGPIMVARITPPVSPPGWSPAPAPHAGQPDPVSRWLTSHRSVSAGTGSA